MSFKLVIISKVVLALWIRKSKADVKKSQPANLKFLKMFFNLKIGLTNTKMATLWKGKRKTYNTFLCEIFKLLSSSIWKKGVKQAWQNYFRYLFVS